MPMQIVGMDFKDAEDDQELTAVEALEQGRGINLRCRVDMAEFSALAKLLGEASQHLLGEEPDTFIIECEMDGHGTKLTPYTGNPVEGGILVPEHEVVLGDSTLAFSGKIPTIIAPDPSSADGLYVKVGLQWLVMQAEGEADPAEAAEWETFCRALTDRNTRNEDRRRDEGKPVSYAPRGYTDTLLTSSGSAGPVTNLRDDKSSAQIKSPVKSPARTGLKQVSPSARLRIGTTEYFKNVMVGFHRGRFEPTEGRDGVFTQVGDTQIRIECDDTTGFDTLKAVELLAAYGPSTMQTFLALMGLWIETNVGATYETYLTVRASDLMRYMHRKELKDGGYHTEDQMQKGREVYLLSRAAVPRATLKRHKNGNRVTETFSLDRLLHVQTMTVQRTLEEGKEIQSILEFRFHPNREMYEMLCGDTPQFAEISGKLLAYHPIREKYQILIGFGLAFYDRVNRKHSKESHKISLLALLALSSIEVPNANVSRFLSQIEAAVKKLDADSVIPGVALELPSSISYSARQQLDLAQIVFPTLARSRQNLLTAPPKNELNTYA